MVQVLNERISEIYKQMECKDRVISEMELRLSDQEKLHAELMNIFQYQINNNNNNNNTYKQPTPSKLTPSKKLFDSNCSSLIESPDIGVSLQQDFTGEDSIDVLNRQMITPVMEWNNIAFNPISTGNNSNNSNNLKLDFNSLSY